MIIKLRFASSTKNYYLCAYQKQKHIIMKKLLSIFLMLMCISLGASAAVNSKAAVYGDVDGDGHVTINDVTVLYNYILNEDMTFFSTSDVDGDGYVTSGDVTVVYNILLGLIPPEDTHEYVDLGLPSGTLWATMNIGANAPEEFGDHFAWGETTPKEVYDWSTYQWCNGRWNKMTKYCIISTHGDNGFTDGKTELDPEDDAASVNWSSQWRMPSKEQLDELRTKCTWTWTTSNGVKGYRVSKNGKSIFLPAAEAYSGSILSSGNLGYYWSRTLGDTKSYYANYLYFYSTSVTAEAFERSSGCTVRAVRVSQK